MPEKTPKLLNAVRFGIAGDVFWVHSYDDGSISFMKQAGDRFYGFQRRRKRAGWYKMIYGVRGFVPCPSPLARKKVTHG